jgi:SAM-dependent methyltransferase
MSIGQRLFMPLLDWRARRVARQVARHLYPPCNVLDFGSGNGLICKYVQQLSNVDIMGVDTVPYAAAPIPMMLYDGVTIPFPDGKFDTVMSLFVLHHCADPDASLDECVRVAHSRLLIVEDVYDGPISKKILDVDDWLANRIETTTVNVPFNFRTVPGWRQTFAARGLTIEAEERVWPFPRHPIKSVLFVLRKGVNGQ